MFNWKTILAVVVVLAAAYFLKRRFKGTTAGVVGNTVYQALGRIIKSIFRQRPKG
jgi:Ni,Fe-hydrogenase I cytochrome b subunit